MKVEHFTVDVSLGADRARLDLQGELDIAAAPVLLERFEGVCDGDGQSRSLILIDMSQLTYCDSSGIRVLLQAAARCEQDGTRFRVIGANATVRRVFEVTDTVEILNLDHDDD